MGGTEISSGSPANNPCGSPLASLTALANELCVERGLSLTTGMAVICGHCCQATFVGRSSPAALAGGARPAEWGEAQWKQGDTLRAEFEGLGSVETTLLD